MQDEPETVGAPDPVPSAAPARVRIVIESDAVDVPEAVLRSVAADAARAVGGRINVTSAELLVNGLAVEVERR